MTQIEALILRSVIEYKQKVPSFLLKAPKEWFSPDARSVYEIIEEVFYDTKKPFNLVYFASVIDIKLFTEVLKESPTIDIEPFYEVLQKQYLLKVQADISLELQQASRESRICDTEKILSQIKKSSTNIKSFKEWLQYFDENKIKLTKYELDINFLDVALHGGIELGQLVLISGEYEAGKTSLCLQILENLSKNHKTTLFSFEFPVESYVLKKNERLEKALLNGEISLAVKENILENMLIIDEGMNMSEVAANIVFLASSGVKFFVVDSQMRLVSENARSLEEEESEKFAILADLAHKYRIVIFLIVQTSKNDTKSPLGSKKGGHYSSITIRIEQNKSKDDQHYHDPNSRTIIIQKNKQTGIHGKYNVEFDTENLTFHSNEVVKYNDYRNVRETKMQVESTISLDDLDFPKL